MNIDQEYNSIISKFSVREEIIKKILKIFEGTGESQIITSDIVPKPLKIKDFIIPSDEIERALNIILSKLRELQQDKEAGSANMFYFSQYGGSKTQFLNLVENEINLEVPNCIIVLFEDLYRINPLNIFDKIIAQIFQIIANTQKIVEDPVKYKKLSSELRQFIGEIQLAIQQSSNLKKAEDLLSKLREINNIEKKDIIEELDTLLHSTVLVDSIDILNKIIKLMQFCSQNDVIFLFLFDEADLWIDDSEGDLKFSKPFMRNSQIMKLIFEIPDSNIKVFNVFACTDRVNLLFQNYQYKFENISPVSSRLNRIYNNAEKILEPGNYGSQIENATVNLAAYYHLASNRMKMDTEILQKMIPLLNDKYKSLSRRLANSKIIQLLRNYEILSPSLEIGLKNWKNNIQTYGTLIQDNLSAILNRLAIKFIREDLSIDPDGQYSRFKIDGFFSNYSLNDEEVKTAVEIILTKEFTGDRAYQGLKYLQIHQEEKLIMLIFSLTPKETINKIIIQYAENNGFDKFVYERMYAILIEEPLAFCAINDSGRLSGDPNSIMQFLDAYANWFEFFSDFSINYRKIIQKIGVEPKIKIKGPEIPPIPSLTSLPTSPQEYELSPEEQTCVNLLSNLYHRNKFSSTGRMNKSSIQNFISVYSLGITDLEKYLEIMKQSSIVVSITKFQVVFAPQIIRATSLEDLTQKMTALFKYK